MLERKNTMRYAGWTALAAVTLLSVTVFGSATRNVFNVTKDISYPDPQFDGDILIACPFRVEARCEGGSWELVGASRPLNCEPGEGMEYRNPATSTTAKVAWECTDKREEIVSRSQAVEISGHLSSCADAPPTLTAEKSCSYICSMGGSKQAC